MYEFKKYSNISCISPQFHARSMEQGLSCVANSRSVGQETPVFPWNTKVHCGVYRNPEIVQFH
jgi:hypothetical protein